MVQVLEKKKQHEASRFYLGKHVPESCPQKTRSCVLIRTSCYFSRCQVNVCLQEKSFRGACTCLLGQVPQTGLGGRTQQERVSRGPRAGVRAQLCFPKSPPPQRLLLHLHTRGLFFLLCLSWSKCPLLLRRPMVCVSAHPVASFKCSFLLRDVGSRYSHTEIRAASAYEWGHRADK